MKKQSPTKRAVERLLIPDLLTRFQDIAEKKSALSRMERDAVKRRVSQLIKSGVIKVAKEEME